MGTDLNNSSLEVELVDQATGYRCTPTVNGDLPILASGVDAGGIKRNILTDATGAVRISPKPATGAITTQLLYQTAVTPINNARWFDLRRYTVPAGYYMEMAKFFHMSTANGTDARVIIKRTLGSFSNVTNSFTDGGTYTSPAFAASMMLYVTTTGFTVNNDIITVTYTNQDGVTGRTATATILKNAAVGDRYVCTLQAGDYGITDVTNVTHSVANTTGEFVVEGAITVSYITATTGNVMYTDDLPSNSIIANAGDIVGIEYLGGNATLRTSLVSVLKPT